MGYLKQLEEEYKQRKEMKEKGLISKSKFNYFDYISKIINNAHDDEFYKEQVDILTGKSNGIIRFCPHNPDFYKDAREAAIAGLDSYKRFMRGTSDDDIYIANCLSDFYEMLVNDFAYDFELTDYEWGFDTISFEDIIAISRKEGISGVKKSIEGEIYDRIISKKD